jgi:hypothetical protein
MTIEERLVELEWQNVKLKVVLGLLLCLVILGLWRRPVAPASVDFKRVVTEELSVVDANGEEICSIRAGHDGPHPQNDTSFFQVKAGSGAATIMAWDGGSKIETHGGASRAALVTIGQTGSAVMVSNEKAEVNLINFDGDSKEKEPRMFIKDGTGRLRAEVGVNGLE